MVRPRAQVVTLRVRRTPLPTRQCPLLRRDWCLNMWCRAECMQSVRVASLVRGFSLSSLWFTFCFRAHVAAGDYYHPRCDVCPWLAGPLGAFAFYFRIFLGLLLLVRTLPVCSCDGTCPSFVHLLVVVLSFSAPMLSGPSASSF